MPMCRILPRSRYVSMAAELSSSGVRGSTRTQTTSVRPRYSALSLRWPTGRRRLTRHACRESFHDSRVEIGSGAALELRDSFLDRARFAVRAVGGHGAEGVARPDNACD